MIHDDRDQLLRAREGSRIPIGPIHAHTLAAGGRARPRVARAAGWATGAATSLVG